MKIISIPVIIAFLFIGCSQPQKDNSPVNHTFIYHSSAADKVSVAGSFNNWSATADPMTYNGNGEWKTEVPLKPDYYQYKYVVDGKWIPDPENEWRINDGGDSFNSIIKAGNPPVPQREKSSRPFPKDKLPEPVLETQPELVELYYAAWQMAWNKIRQGTEENGFATAVSGPTAIRREPPKTAYPSRATGNV